MCEMILTGLIMGRVNVGPDVYVIQGFDYEGNFIECEMILTPIENEINF